MNEQATVLTVQQKLDILNGLKVVEVDQRSEDEFSVFVADEATTISALQQVGLNESDIEATFVDAKVRDIAVIGFQIGADFYDRRDGWMLWTAEQKIDMLNELNVVGDDCEADTCLYVLVHDNQLTRDTLDSLGYDASELVNEDDMIDIAPIAWACGAAWWDGKKFLAEKPEPYGGGRPAESR